MQPGVAERVHEICGSDYFILPSSQHELIIVPDDSSIGIEDLINMVDSANKTCVDPEELLSYKVFHYGREGIKEVA